MLNKKIDIKYDKGIYIAIGTRRSQVIKKGREKQISQYCRNRGVYHNLSWYKWFKNKGICLLLFHYLIILNFKTKTNGGGGTIIWNEKKKKKRFLWCINQLHMKKIINFKLKIWHWWNSRDHFFIHLIFYYLFLVYSNFLLFTFCFPLRFDDNFGPCHVKCEDSRGMPRKILPLRIFILQENSRDWGYIIYILENRTFNYLCHNNIMYSFYSQWNLDNRLLVFFNTRLNTTICPTYSHILRYGKDRVY